MAVIRQKTQIFNQPVGVVRADAGGAQVGEAISNAASRISQLAYREAAQNAEAAGKKAAQSQPSDKIIAIDPTTNMPVAYTPPASFGTIAARSYQNMIDRRFEESILSEFAAKGSEFASSSSSADQYKSRISNYIQEMYNSEGEATPYSRYIEEAGKEYVASTYASLAKKQAEAAKKALINQQLMAGYLDEKKLVNLIGAGASNEDITSLANSLRARYLDLKDTDSMTFKQWRSANDRIDGLEGLYANNNLIDIYSTLSPSDQSLFKLGLTKPNIMSSLANKIGSNNLETLALEAKTTTSIPTLLAGLDSFASIADEYVENQTNSILSEVGPNISASTSVIDIVGIGSKIEDESVQKEVMSELLAKWVEKNLDAAGKKASDIDIISEALLDESSPDYQAIADLIGGNQGESVAKQIQGMTQEQRSNLATEISERRAALLRMESKADLEEENRLRQSLIDFQNATDLNASFQSALSNIESSTLDEVKQQTLRELARQNFAEQSRIRVDRIKLSKTDIQNLKNAVTQEKTDLKGNVKEAYDLLREAYKFDASSTSAYLDRKLKAITEQNNRYIIGMKIDAIQSNLPTASPNDLAEYDSYLFKDEFITAGNMLEFPQIVEAFNQGVVLPSAKVAMESALTSLNEDVLNNAIQVFDKFSNLEATTEDGRRTDLDVMRKNLSPETYALYSALNFVAREQGVEPLSIALEFRNYDGNVDNDIKADLDLPKGGNINRALDTYPMSSNYKKEILATLRMQKVRGNVITEDLISSVINTYTSRMKKDPSVVGPYIGDSTAFPRNNYFSNDEIIANRNQLTNLLADSGQFNDLLKGDNALDAMASTLGGILGSDVILTSRAIVEIFTTGVGANEELSDRNRIRQGLAALNIDLKYNPVVSSIESGVPMYEVGYLDQFDSFQPIMINDQTWTLEKTESTRKQDLTLQSFNNLTVANNADAPKSERAIAEINYLASLPHMDEETFINNPSNMATYKEIFGDNATALNIFRSRREVYTGSKNAKDLNLSLQEIEEIQNLPTNVPPRPNRDSKYTDTEIMTMNRNQLASAFSDIEAWDSKYGNYYNLDGSLKEQYAAAHAVPPRPLRTELYPQYTDTEIMTMTPEQQHAAFPALYAWDRLYTNTHNNDGSLRKKPIITGLNK